MAGKANPGARPGDGVRPLKVGEELRHVLAEVLARGGVRDLEIDGRLVTVTEVRMSPDLRVATVFVRGLGGAGEATLVGALAKAARGLRTEIVRRVRLRTAPELRFRLDESLDAAAGIDALLRRPDIARDLGD